MKQYNIKNQQEYIDEVIWPRHQSLVNGNNIFAIKDKNFTYLFCSNRLAQYLGLSDGQAIKNKTIADFPQLGANVVEESRNSDNLVKHYLRPIEEILILADSQAVIVNKMPLFYPDGSFFGIRETIRKFELIYPFQIMQKIGSANDILRQNQLTPTLPAINEEEKAVLFLLLSGHGRSYIAELMKVNISRISRIIAELCNRFGVISHHQERLINYAITRGIYRFIPEIIMRRLRYHFPTMS